MLKFTTNNRRRFLGNNDCSNRASAHYYRRTIMEQKDLKAPMTMEQMEKQYEGLGLENQFIFGKVMKNKELCTKMLECLTGNKINDVNEITVEKYVKICTDSKGVRYDVFIEDNLNRIYDAEMQNLTTVTKEELPLRSRLYQGMIDLVALESGMDYTKLKESYVIFICTSDPFDRNLGCYSITNTCQEDISLPYNDKRTILFYNTKGSYDSISEDAKDFLNYIETRKIKGRYIKQLDDAVNDARKNKEWRVEYMHSLVHDWDMINKGKREGLKEGRLESLISLVKDGDIGIDVAAKKAEMDIEEFESLLNET